MINFYQFFMWVFFFQKSNCKKPRDRAALQNWPSQQFYGPRRSRSRGLKLKLVDGDSWLLWLLFRDHFVIRWIIIISLFTITKSSVNKRKLRFEIVIDSKAELYDRTFKILGLRIETLFNKGVRKEPWNKKTSRGKY